MLLRVYCRRQIKSKQKPKQKKKHLKYQLETIAFPICFYYTQLPVPAFNAFSMLHAKNSCIATAMDIFKYILIIYLPGCRLISSRVITDMECANAIPACFNVWYQVPFCDLLMIHV